MRLSLIFITLLMASSAQGQSSGRPNGAVRPVTGSYTLKLDQQSGCELMVEQVADSSVRFRLDCNRGAPSYHLGIAQGTVPLRGRTALYSPGNVESCQLTLQFEEKSVRIRQAGTPEDCGFERGVDASGSYALVDSATPAWDLVVSAE